MPPRKKLQGGAITPDTIKKILLFPLRLPQMLTDCMSPVLLNVAQSRNDRQSEQEWLANNAQTHVVPIHHELFLGNLKDKVLAEADKISPALTEEQKNKMFNVIVESLDMDRTLSTLNANTMSEAINSEGMPKSFINMFNLVIKSQYYVFVQNPDNTTDKGSFAILVDRVGDVKAQNMNRYDAALAALSKMLKANIDITKDAMLSKELDQMLSRIEGVIGYKGEPKVTTIAVPLPQVQVNNNGNGNSMRMYKQGQQYEQNYTNVYTMGNVPQNSSLLNLSNRTLRYPMKGLLQEGNNYKYRLTDEDDPTNTIDFNVFVPNPSPKADTGMVVGNPNQSNDEDEDEGELDGGKPKVEKVKVLGRTRNVIKEGRRKYVMVKGVKTSLTEAKKMEKTTRK